MRNRLFKVFYGIYNQAGMLAGICGCSFAAVLAAATGYIAKQTSWIVSYGPIGWEIAGLLGAIVGLLIFVFGSLGLFFVHKAYAMRRWSREVDTVNPLENSFNRKRIKISDLMPTYVQKIERKTFTDCELSGPANIILAASRPSVATMTGCSFFNSAGVVMRDDAYPPNAIWIWDCTFVNCKISDVLLFVPETHYGQLKIGGMPWLTPGYPKDVAKSGHPIPMTQA